MSEWEPFLLGAPDSYRDWFRLRDELERKGLSGDTLDTATREQFVATHTDDEYNEAMTFRAGLTAGIEAARADKDNGDTTKLH